MQVTPDDAVNESSQEARTGVELWRSVAAASAVVERRQASALRFSASRARMARRMEECACRCSASFFVCCPSGVQRNPGTIEKLERPIPGFAALNPGYVRRA